MMALIVNVTLASLTMALIVLTKMNVKMVNMTVMPMPLAVILLDHIFVLVTLDMKLMESNVLPLLYLFYVPPNQPMLVSFEGKSRVRTVRSNDSVTRDFSVIICITRTALRGAIWIVTIFQKLFRVGRR